MVRDFGRGCVAAALSGLMMAATACDQPASPRLAADIVGGTGTLGVAATSSGPSLHGADDPDGYVVRVDTAGSQHIDANGVVTYTGLSAGAHRVDLYDIVPNCWSLDNDPRAVDVTAGVAGTTRFDVGCVAEGTIYITDTTTGVDLDADGYAVTVDGNAAAAIAPNDSAWANGVASGTHSVALTGLAANCTVSGPNPQEITLSSGTTVPVTFAVSCAPTGSGSGTLTVITNTTGSNFDPDGYTLTLDGTASQAMGLADTVSMAVVAGAHPVALSGLAANCTVGDANPRTVSVAASGTDTTTFSVTCGAAPPAEVVAEGQLKMGPATLGNDVQTFSLDVRADGTGRFAYTDYGNVQANGNPAMLIADPAADPGTSFTAYRDGSSACADPTRGVELDGMGRDPNDGTLLPFTVELCDNGPAGAGADFFSFFAPPPLKNYGRSGAVTSGDIAKQ